MLIYFKLIVLLFISFRFIFFLNKIDDNRLDEYLKIDLGDGNQNDLDINLTTSTMNLSRLSSNVTTIEDKDSELRILKSENKKLLDTVTEYKLLLTMYR